MSASSQSASSSSPTNTQPTGCVVDPLELLDFSEYDRLPFHSPAVSPATGSKPLFNRHPTAAPPTTMPSGPTMQGPSHRYDQYKQQTPFVPGALATTMAINQNNPHMGYSLDYMQSNNMSPNEDMFDFNAPSQSSPSMEMDFESQPEASFFFPEPTINPNAIGGRDSALPSPPPVTSNVGRMYPGMHQQAALAKAQQQQRQQQQIIQAQQQQRQHHTKQQQRPKSAQPSDPMVEQKITQLLNSMRARTGHVDNDDNSPLLNLPRSRKDEEDMDEDERLLASEEGKKLSSKERRQLRNKVSARAFRSRRKEYITQLEAEIASKVTENGDIRAQNRALVEENKRLSDLTRMLLSSPSFSNFLDHLSSGPAGAQQQPAPQVEQRQSEQRQMPKDVNPYAAAHHSQQQQIGMVMIPEQTMDFSMLNLDSNNEGGVFNYQPQVFTVETPEMPEIDTAVLSGKASDVVTGLFESINEKVEIAVAEPPVLFESAKAQSPTSPVATSVSEKAVADLDSDIFEDDTCTSETNVVEAIVDGLSSINVFAGIQSEKAVARYELVDASKEQAVATRALARVQHLTANLEATMARLERLTIDL
ncbi:bZIP transcription factor [Xylariales sp. AK1849]|nr:bZIP transcription factor [Xylariales sp. AK1849]